MPGLTDLRPLGRTRLRVTALGLGTAPLAGLYEPVSDDVADAVVQTAWDLGIRFFDTAPQYGHGAAERRLGRNLLTRPRDEFVLATKVGRLLRRGRMVGKRYFYGTPDEVPVFDFSYDGVMRSVEESLERLGLERVDILHIHDPDDHPHEALDGALRALVRLRSEGTISAVGAGMNQAEMLARFALTGQFDCFLLAGRYTLLEQGALDTLLPVALSRRIAIIAGGVYNSGLLASPIPGARYDYDEAPVAKLQRAQALESVCRSHGVPLRAAAVQFPWAHPAVSSVLTGARNPDELRDTCACFQLPIPDQLWEDLKDRGLLRPDAPVPADPG